MRKILLVFILLLTINFTFATFSFGASVSVDSFVSPDNVTITALETMRSTFQGAINSADGSLIQSTSISSGKLDANSNPTNRWNEAFADFVYTGLSIPTSVSLSSTTASGTAYITGVRVPKDAIAKTYTASKHTYVDLSSTGVYTYSETAIGAGTPAVANDSIRLARVSTDATTVISVRDDRNVGVKPATSNYVVGSFTRNFASGNGDQSVTGVGFRPSAVYFMGGVNGDDVLAFGIATSSTGASIYDNNNGATDTWAIVSSGAVFSIASVSGGEARATGITFDIDGFTLAWVALSGSPSGTGTIMYIAFR